MKARKQIMDILQHQLFIESRRIEASLAHSLGSLGYATSTGNVQLNGIIHELVSHDSSVNGAVYINRGMLGAAVKIDAECDKDLRDLYEQFRPVFERIADTSRTAEGLLGLAALVAASIPYDNVYVDEIDRTDGYLFANRLNQKLVI